MADINEDEIYTYKNYMKDLLRGDIDNYGMQIYLIDGLFVKLASVGYTHKELYEARIDCIERYGFKHVPGIKKYLRFLVKKYELDKPYRLKVPLILKYEPCLDYPCPVQEEPPKKDNSKKREKKKTQQRNKRQRKRVEIRIYKNTRALIVENNPRLDLLEKKVQSLNPNIKRRLYPDDKVIEPNSISINENEKRSIDSKSTCVNIISKHGVSLSTHNNVLLSKIS